jgi:hypothetical protein
MKVGDKVKSLSHPGRVFTLVWYKKGDTTCAIADEKIRLIAKTYTISLAT